MLKNILVLTASWILIGCEPANISYDDGPTPALWISLIMSLISSVLLSYYYSRKPNNDYVEKNIQETKETLLPKTDFSDQ